MAMAMAKEEVGSCQGFLRDSTLSLIELWEQATRVHKTICRSQLSEAPGLFGKYSLPEAHRLYENSMPGALGLLVDSG